ncbi:hypothetical protein [Nostoc sp. MG11]|uniref:hypothetical protein n=1 Tax=Nostoc sp. MG11 TaxID=2721166 RepID=UPI001865D911|nr:hypothetical protein [Nostoc sp. MG11]
MPKKNSKSRNSSARETFLNAESAKTALLATRLQPTSEQIIDWLRSPQIKQWLIKLPMGIPNNLKIEALLALSSATVGTPDQDCRVVIGGNSAIGVNVLHWQLWASYKLPYAHAIKAPDCPYTLKKHLSGETNKPVLGFGQG